MKVQVKIGQLMPDRTDFKKYSVVYQPQDLLVEVDVPAGLAEQEGENVVLREEGLVWLVGHLADLIDKIDELHAKDVQKKQ